MISPWGNQLPTMTYGRHSAGAVVLGLFWYFCILCFVFLSFKVEFIDHFSNIYVY
jgi:hypothetical protein